MFIKDDWEFNVLGIYKYRKKGNLRHYFSYLVEHHDYIEGDILEAGVYNGRSLLATGLLLKELGSSKQVYGFDSFEGFPRIFHKKDELTNFNILLNEERISTDHFAKVNKLIHFRATEINDEITVKNISRSGDFSNVNLNKLERKIEFLELDNIHIISGPFSETMTQAQIEPKKLMAALIDCDLYMSYQQALPFVWGRLSLGGYVYLDEYYSLKFAGARIATDEFFANRIDKPFKHKDSPGDFERWYVRKLHN